MIDLYTPRQIQWIIRIILKGEINMMYSLIDLLIYLFADLNIQLSELSILTVLHPNAKELYESGRSLRELCNSVADPKGFESSFNVRKFF